MCKFMKHSKAIGGSRANASRGFLDFAIFPDFLKCYFHQRLLNIELANPNDIEFCINCLQIC
jgi:hypothetical protein